MRYSPSQCVRELDLRDDVLSGGIFFGDDIKRGEDHCCRNPQARIGQISTRTYSVQILDEWRHKMMVVAKLPAPSTEGRERWNWLATFWEKPLWSELVRIFVDVFIQGDGPSRP